MDTDRQIDERTFKYFGTPVLFEVYFFAITAILFTITIIQINQYQNYGDSIIIMMPSDHVVKETKLFHKAVAAGIEMANDDYLVTFGIKPTQAETGYGYIQTAKKIPAQNKQDIFSIGGFTEKPDKALAEKYLSSGSYLWNSGIYMMKASVWLKKIQQHQKSIALHRLCYE